jgi:hypothetical protein
MATFKSFGNMAERPTARACTSLIGAHGPHFIGRYYPCKGYTRNSLMKIRTNLLLI